MSAAPEPGEPEVPTGSPQISEAAQTARERLHAEIERVRSGVEELLDRSEAANGTSRQPKPLVPPTGNEEVRRELEQLRIETRDYVKKKIRRSEKKLERSVRELEERSDELEERIDRVRTEREEAEWRIHNNTEQMLDGLIDAVRSIADQLARQPRALPPPPPTPAAPAPPSPPRRRWRPTR